MSDQPAQPPRPAIDPARVIDYQGCSIVELSADEAPNGAGFYYFTDEAPQQLHGPHETASAAGISFVLASI